MLICVAKRVLDEDNEKPLAALIGVKCPLRGRLELDSCSTPIALPQLVHKAEVQSAANLLQEFGRGNIRTSFPTRERKMRLVPTCFASSATVVKLLLSLALRIVSEIPQATSA